MVTVIKEYGFSDLKEMVWSGAIHTLEMVESYGLEDELMDLLEQVFSEGATETEINDFLWHDSDTVFDMLGIEEE